MPIERQPTSIGTKLESVYAGVEMRARVLSDLWQRTQSLPIPRRSDSEEAVTAEQDFLVGSLEPFFEARPELREKLDRAIAVRIAIVAIPLENFEEERKKPEVRALFDEQRQMYEDKDLSFLRSVYINTMEALRKRESLREKQGEDEEIDEFGQARDVEGYQALYPEGHLFRGNVTRVVFRKFSVNLFISEKVFEAHFGPRILGRSEGLTNSIKDVRALRDKLLLRSGGSRSLQQYDETLRHEDFHSLTERSFETDQSVESLEKYYESLAEARKKLRDRNPESEESYRRELVELAEKIGDAQWQELLAELASTEDRYNVPKSTFGAIDGKKTTLLERIIREQGDLIPDAKRLDADTLREKIRSIYERVDISIPDRRTEVDALFVLFQPRKIRLISRIVDRWIAQAV